MTQVYDTDATCDMAPPAAEIRLACALLARDRCICGDPAPNCEMCVPGIASASPTTTTSSECDSEGGTPD